MEELKMSSKRGKMVHCLQGSLSMGIKLVKKQGSKEFVKKPPSSNRDKVGRSVRQSMTSCCSDWPLEESNFGKRSIWIISEGHLPRPAL